MKITEIVALVSAIAFVLTVIYIYAFSWSIGVDLFPYISFNDYLKLSVCWLPHHLLSIFIAFIIPIFLLRLITGKAIHPTNILSLPPKFTMFKKEPLKVIPVSIGLTLISILIILLILDFRQFLERVIYVICVSTVIFLWLTLVHHRREFSFIKQWPDWKQYVLVFGPLYFMLVFVAGLYTGKKELVKVVVHNNSNAQLEMTSKEPNKNGRVLFALSQYIVFLEKKTKTVDIIPIGQVKNIITIPKNKSKEKGKDKETPSEEAKKKQKETIK